MRPAAITQAERDVTFTRVTSLGLLTLALIVWFGNIGYRTLAEPDEARYAEISREMLASADWVTPHLNGIPYFEKPPLQYWATAAAYSIFGVAPWVARLWVVGLGFLGIVIAYWTSRKLWGSRTAEYTAIVLGSLPLYFIVTHINTLDGALSFFLNAAICSFLMAHRPTTDLVMQRWWMYLCWLCVALGFLQKGLIAVVLPALSLMMYSLIHRDWRLWRSLHLPEGLLILATVALPWVILAAQRNPGFLKFFFVNEHLARFATTVHQRAEPWWYFIAMLIVGVLPWVEPIAKSVIRAIRFKAGAPSATPVPERILLSWAFTPLLFFSFSGSKLAPYIVPMATPLAMLAGRWLDLQGTLRSLRSVVAISAVLSLLWICMPWLLPQFVRPGLKLTTYLQVAEWAQFAGFAGFGCIVLFVIAARAEVMRLAVIALAASIGLPSAISGWYLKSGIHPGAAVLHRLATPETRERRRCRIRRCRSHVGTGSVCRRPFRLAQRCRAWASSWQCALGSRQHPSHRCRIPAESHRRHRFGSVPH